MCDCKLQIDFAMPCAITHLQIIHFKFVEITDYFKWIPFSKGHEKAYDFILIVGKCVYNKLIFIYRIYLCRNRNILYLPVTPSLLTCSIFKMALSWAMTHWRTSRKQTLAKPARKHLTTQSVTNLATQPENNLATQPEKQPGDTARKTTLARLGGLAAHNGLEATFTGNRR